MSRARRFFDATEIDARMIGMIGALAAIWMAMHLFSGGIFLTPRNLWNLSVQTASVSVMATGMVLIIVSRNVDLSIGSLLGLCAMIIGALQVDVLPQYTSAWPVGSAWVIAIIAGLSMGAAIGAFQGWLIAYLSIPSFIVTLGGLMVWRGTAWWVTSGRTVAPMDPTYRLLGGGGGPEQSIGPLGSAIIAGIAIVTMCAHLFVSRRRRVRFGFPPRPVWAEIVLGLAVCSAIAGAVAIFNSYPWPAAIAARYAADQGLPVPEGGLFLGHGIATPVLIAVACGLLMSFIASRTKFGRYILAIGGNPEAAALAGINTRRVTLSAFALMGLLAGIGAVISSARLNAATNSLGTLDELLVISAAVIGGTSLSGGVGTVFGAMLGALLMQSLQSGMVLMRVDAPMQSIVVGTVLVLAVWLDFEYRKRSA